MRRLGQYLITIFSLFIMSLGVYTFYHEIILTLLNDRELSHYQGGILVGCVNTIGISILLISHAIFGINSNQKWCWINLLLAFIWVSLHFSYILSKLHYSKLHFLWIISGAIGLLLTYPKKKGI